MGLVHASAEVDAGAVVDRTSTVWSLAHIRTGAKVGSHCVIGRGVYIGPGVSVGSRSKIQNYASLYEPATLGEGVFIGPGVILTNDQRPRAVRPDGTPKSVDDWDAVGVRIDDGASIGARAVCVAPVHVGAWALVGAGAIVTKDVPAYALVVGTPAEFVGWVGRSGSRLVPGGVGRWICPVTGESYREIQTGIEMIEREL